VGAPSPLGLLEGIATTRAIRRFRPDPIAESDLATMFFAATRAPSGSNSQGFRFIVLRDGPVAAQAKVLLGRAFREQWVVKRQAEGIPTSADPDSRLGRALAAMDTFVQNFESTPVVVIACLIRQAAPSPREGASIYPACQNLLLAARALGCGGVFSMWHTAVEPELRSLLGIPDGVAISATIPLGRPQGSHGPVRRRPLRELVFEERWAQPAVWAVDPEGTAFTRGNQRPAWTGSLDDETAVVRSWQVTDGR
jgi:nitroreductase